MSGLSPLGAYGMDPAALEALAAGQSPLGTNSAADFGKLMSQFGIGSEAFGSNPAQSALGLNSPYSPYGTFPSSITSLQELMGSQKGQSLFPGLGLDDDSSDDSDNDSDSDSPLGL